MKLKTSFKAPSKLNLSNKSAVFYKTLDKL